MSLRSSACSLFGLLTVAGMLAACGGRSTPIIVTPSPAPTPVIPSATPVPPRSLTICVGQEPASLFPLNNPSSAARAILAAVYEGPVETNSYGFQPVILKDLPSLANGDVQLFQKTVNVGEEVVDAGGTPVTLAAGMKVRPAGCHDDTCAVVYDGKSPLQMDQMQATFRLLPGLTWSDGQPLTAADSVFAFMLASAPDVPASRYLVERTKSYEAAGDTTLQWWGKPGFIDPTYASDFWPPLPKHLWDQIPADQLAQNPAAARSPLGWGPYVIREWAAGDHITLAKNVHYFRSAEGLPKFDTLIFRFVPDPAAAVSALTAGSCDILDPSINLDGQVDQLRSLAAEKKVQVSIAAPPLMEQLAFGIHPAAYDNGYNAGQDRPDYLGDARVRQAVAMCIDRQKVVDTVLHGLSTLPASFVPAADPLSASGVTIPAFDAAAANALLEKAGWRQMGSSPSTPRQAWGVPNVPDGTPLELHYITTGAAQRVQVSKMVADSLAQCGIQVDIKILDQAALYAAGPDGPLFGRNFDLAEFAMGSTALEPPCDWFTSAEIPDAANRWVGTNVSGYSSPAFDAACQAAQSTLFDDPAHLDAYRQAQSIFVQDLPVLPLYWRLKVAAARPEVCHFSLDPTAASPLWNIASIDAGASCGQ